jgi:hypothetical protein
MPLPADGSESEQTAWVPTALCSQLLSLSHPKALATD